MAIMFTSFKGKISTENPKDKTGKFGKPTARMLNLETKKAHPRN
jgi:hypothetical protein